MAYLERIEPIGYRWTPTVTVPEAYAGRHRHEGRRRFSLLAMFYAAAHAHYVPRHARTAGSPPRYAPRHSRLG